MNSYFSLLNRQNKQKSSGFTLVEVIIASSMTMVVVTIAGIGVAAMTRSNIKSNLESDIQNTTNMAMELIVGEVREGEKAEIVTTGLDTKMTEMVTAIKSDSTNASYTLPTGATPVLVVTKDQSSTSFNIIYFTAPLPSNKPKWLLGKPGDIALYRWGPSQLDDGTYKDHDDPSKWGQPAIIMDILSKELITSDKQAKKNKEDCSDTFLAAKNTSNEELKGFYVCISQSNRLAQLHVVAQATPTNLAENSQPIEYKVDTQAFARSRN